MELTVAMHAQVIDSNGDPKWSYRNDTDSRDEWVHPILAELVRNDYTRRVAQGSQLNKALRGMSARAWKASAPPSM